MWWNQIVGQKKIINQLKYSIEYNRVPHAQIFIGKLGYGSLALALALSCEILYRENVKNKFKLEQLMHLDLHFSFPSIKRLNAEAISDIFINDWIKFIKKNIYASLNDWYTFIDNKDSQGVINVKEVEIISYKMFLQSLEGGSKFMIIWMMDKMNEVASNKLLKLLEEPPKNTYFILIVNDEDLVLKTIISRCQIIYVSPINDEDIYKELNKLNNRINTNKDLIDQLVYQSSGNWNKVLKILNQLDKNEKFEEYLIYFLRHGVQIKKKIQVLKNLNKLSLFLSELSKEDQKRFINYTLEIFRQAFIYNFKIQKLQNLKLSKNNFNWENFTKYIHKNNINLILEALSKSFYYIDRNANSKILFLNMLISISNFLHIESI